MLVRPGTLMSSSIGTGEGSAFSVEASALFAAMSTQPDATRKTLVDDTIGALKAAGIWDDLDCLYVLAAHHSSAALLNWVNPGTHDCVPSNSPTFEVDRGYTGNGSTSRLHTQYAPSTDAVRYTLNDASAWVWWRTGAPAATTDIGSQAAPRTAIQANSSGTTAAGVINTSNFSSFANGGAAPGLVGMQRTTSTHQRLFKDGAQVGSDEAQASTGLPIQIQWICGGNGSNFSVRQVAAAAWGASLTGKEAAFYAAMNTYMQAVGAA